jgi:hypothetical protein
MNVNRDNGSAESQPDVALRERIEKRAYHHWLAAGGVHGEHLHHWLKAESEVLKAIKTEQEEPATARKARPRAKKSSSSRFQ